MKERILTGPRAIVRDLVSKRLWPIALLLVAALVAVPVVIGRSASTTPPPAVPAPAPATASAPESAVVVSAPAVTGANRPGPVSDPFFHPPKPKSTSTSTVTSAAPSSATSSSTPGTGTTPGTSTTPATSAGTGTSTGGPAPSSNPSSGGGDTTPAPSDLTVYRARVRWGADSSADVRGLSRLQPLGGLTNPALLYLGVTPSHKLAVFLLGPNALFDGDGRCAETSCRVFVLKPGEKTAIGVVGVDGAPARHFELSVDSIAAVTASSADEALSLRARVHADGRDVLREMIKDPKTAGAIGLFGYDRVLGAVVLKSAP